MAKNKDSGLPAFEAPEPNKGSSLPPPPAPAVGSETPQTQAQTTAPTPSSPASNPQKQKVLVGIELEVKKKTFIEGEVMPPDNITVLARYSDNSLVKIPYGEYLITGLDSRSKGIHRLWVEYGIKAVSVEIEVVEKPQQAPAPVRKQTGIEITQLPKKTVYVQGEELDLDGIVLSRLYSADPKKEQIPSMRGISHSVFDKDKVGDQWIKVHDGLFSQYFGVIVHAAQPEPAPRPAPVIPAPLPNPQAGRFERLMKALENRWDSVRGSLSWKRAAIILSLLAVIIGIGWLIGHRYAVRDSFMAFLKGEPGASGPSTFEHGASYAAASTLATQPTATISNITIAPIISSNATVEKLIIIGQNIIGSIAGSPVGSLGEESAKDVWDTIPNGKDTFRKNGSGDKLPPAPSEVQPKPAAPQPEAPSKAPTRYDVSSAPQAQYADYVQELPPLEQSYAPASTECTPVSSGYGGFVASGGFCFGGHDHFGHVDVLRIGRPDNGYYYRPPRFPCGAILPAPLPRYGGSGHGGGHSGGHR